MVAICDYDWLKNNLQAVFGYIGPDSGMREELRYDALKPKIPG